MFDPYAILGLNPTATTEDVKQAWRRLARKHHPDRPGGSQAMMSEINKAYNLLLDEEARHRYDMGEGEERPPLDANARSALMQITFACLTQQQTGFVTQNIHDFITHHVRNNQEKFRGEIKAAESMLARAKAQRLNLLFKQEENCIRDTFDQVEAQLKENIDKARWNLKTMERAAQLYAEIVELESRVKAERAALSDLERKARAALSYGPSNPLLGQ